jgi:electron transfer flavoprotein alpha subunit
MVLEQKKSNDMQNQQTENQFDFWGAPPESQAVSTTGIFVFVENNDLEIVPDSFEALGKAKELADALGTGIGAILLNSNDENLAKSLIHVGANKVFLPSDDRFQNYETELYCNELFSLIRRDNPEIFMAALSYFTKDFFPRLAQRIPTGLVSGCTNLEIDTAERSLLATRPIYGGKMFEVITWKKSCPQMVLLQPGFFPPPIEDEFRTGEIEKI